MSEAIEESYHAVINDEEQYSLWPTARDIPPGWKQAGFTGSQTECLAFIRENWTDLRPRSLREGIPAPGPRAASKPKTAAGKPNSPASKAPSRKAAAKKKIARSAVPKKKAAKKITSKTSKKKTGKNAGK